MMPVSVAVRDRVIDIAKGVAIIAIVASHVERGMVLAGLPFLSPVLTGRVDQVLYLMHLPVFAALAGVFVRQGVQRAGAWRYVVSRVSGFFWLYLLWSGVQGIAKIGAGAVVNSPVSFHRVFALWLPSDQFWFLGWIVVMTGLAALAQPWRSRRRAVVTMALACVVSAGAWGLNGALIGTQGLGLTGFFFAGAMLGYARVVRTLARPGPVAQAGVAAAGLGLLVVIACFTGATAPTYGGNGRTAATVLLGGVASCSGVAGVLMVACLGARPEGRCGRWVAVCGRLSLPVFLAHVLFTGSFRIMAERCGVADPLFHFAGGIFAGVVGPLVLVGVARRFRLTWLFAAPACLTRSVPDKTRGRITDNPCPPERRP
jgi:fucose 4-O-acetylase-like acetyltransferase